MQEPLGVTTTEIQRPSLREEIEKPRPAIQERFKRFKEEGIGYACKRWGQNKGLYLLKNK